MAHRLDSPIARIPSPGYHPEGTYEFKADLNGDAVEELTRRITFDERDPADKQRFGLRWITGADAVDPHAPGTVVTKGTTGETATASSGLRLWAERGVQSSGGTVRPGLEHRIGCLNRIIVDDHVIERPFNVRISSESFSPANHQRYVLHFPCKLHSF